MHIKVGRQLWFVGQRDIDNVLKSPEDALNWECADLMEGDHLIMAPGTPHFFITLEDCLAVGGHFYSCAGPLLFRTMMSLVSERFLGLSWTDRECPTSLIILFKMADDVLLRMQALEASQGK